MSIKGKGSFPISTAWCNSNNLRNQVSLFTRSNELKIMMSHYFFGTSNLKRWDGNEWSIDSSIKTYDGVSFTEKPLKTWNGSDWITIQTN